MIKKQSCGWLSCKQLCVVLVSDNTTSLCLDYSICLWLVRAPFLQNSAFHRHEKRDTWLPKEYINYYFHPKIPMTIDAYTCVHSRLKSWSLTITKQMSLKAMPEAVDGTSQVLLLPCCNHKKDLCWQQMAEQSHSGFGFEFDLIVLIANLI